MFGHLDRGVMVGGDELAKRPEPGRHLVEHGTVRRAARPAFAAKRLRRGLAIARLGLPAGGGGHLLLQPRHPEAGSPPDRPPVERDFAGNRLQQAGLAAAVAADERDPLAGLDPQIGVFEQGQVAKGKMPLLEMKDRHSLQVTAT